MNHYEVLGVKPTASQDDIRSAYRKKVMEFHPDHYGNDTSEFRRIQEAYSVLTDPDQRRLYDKSLSEGKHYKRPPAEPFRQYPSERIFNNYDISSIFVELRHKLFHAFSKEQKSYDVEVILNRQEARTGGKINLNIPVHEVCPDCKGYCYRGLSECQRCRGKGIIPYTYPFNMQISPGVLHNDRKEILIKPYNILLRITFQIQ